MAYIIHSTVLTLDKIMAENDDVPEIDGPKFIEKYGKILNKWQDQAKEGRLFTFAPRKERSTVATAGCSDVQVVLYPKYLGGTDLPMKTEMEKFLELFIKDLKEFLTGDSRHVIRNLMNHRYNLHESEVSALDATRIVPLQPDIQ